MYEKENKGDFLPSKWNYIYFVTVSIKIDKYEVHMNIFTDHINHTSVCRVSVLQDYYTNCDPTVHSLDDLHMLKINTGWFRVRLWLEFMYK